MGSRLVFSEPIIISLMLVRFWTWMYMADNIAMAVVDHSLDKKKIESCVGVGVG